jgi:iron complex outermembrane receptor protein
VTDRLSLSGGIRHTRVKFETRDRFITGANGDDSGNIRFSETTPVAGVLFKVSPALNLYANAGRGFETPTFAELAYQSVSATSTGFNFALKPAVSRNFELGLKAHLADRTRLSAALFRADTRDEIVVLINQGGRSVYQNVDRTRRQGIELAIDSGFGRGWHGALSYTWLDAEFANAFLTCGTSAACATPALAVPPGNDIPGVPENSLYGELSWSHRPAGFSTAVEARWADKVFTNDLNDEAADAYTLVNWRAGLEQQRGGWKFSEFLRVDNLLDRKYAGSVIVNAGNGQYYEPAPGRSFLLGFSVQR